MRKSTHASSVTLFLLASSVLEGGVSFQIPLTGAASGSLSTLFASKLCRTGENRIFQQNRYPYVTKSPFPSASRARKMNLGVLQASSAMELHLPSSSPVVVYSTSGCPYCSRAKARLQELGVTYKDVDVSADKALRAKIAELSGGRTTVPQIFIDGKHIGGCDDLLQEDASGELAARLERAGIERKLSVVQDTDEASNNEGKEPLIELGPKDGILNFHDNGGKSLRAEVLARELQGKVLAMYDKFLTKDGHAVDFERMRRSKVCLLRIMLVCLCVRAYLYVKSIL
jgi:glutaredoxin 3